MSGNNDAENDRSISRCTVLQSGITAGTAGIGLSAVSSSVAADENGINMELEDDDVAVSEDDALDLSELNEEVARTELEYVEKDGTMYVRHPRPESIDVEQAQQNDIQIASGTGGDETDVTLGTSWEGPQATIYLDSDRREDFSDATDPATFLVGVFGLAYWPAGVAALIVQADNMSLESIDDGCGIKMTIAPACEALPYCDPIDIEAQECSCDDDSWV